MARQQVVSKSKIATQDTDVERVGAVTQSVMNEVFARLRGGAAVRAAGEPPRLFFPNGIELIDISVSVGLTTKGIAVEIKIAGEKGVKNLLAEGHKISVPAE